MSVLQTNRFPKNKIMLITQPGPHLLTVISSALSNGVGIVQLRDKHATDQEIIQLAKRIKHLTDSYRVPLIINDRLNVACELGLGLHVGQNDTHPREARRMLGPKPLLGLTSHLRVDLIQQASEWIDYIGCGPVYQTRTKLDTMPVIGLTGLHLICKSTPLPVVAIGGINQNNVSPVWRAGAEGIAVCGAICHAADPGKATKRLVEKGE